jgi:hypothetical protein
VSDIDLQKHMREAARWRILRILDAGRPLPVSESTILLALNDAKLALTQQELRRELDYLDDRKLLRLSDQDSFIWSAELTHYGVDVVEYTIACLPGIARPLKC